MDELFPVEQVTMDSPILAWKKKHGIATLYFDERQRFGDYDKWAAALCPGVTGRDAVAQFMCDQHGRNGDMTTGWGSTEEEAMEDLALKQQITHWTVT